MGNASSHSNKNLPLILAGGGFQHGEHKSYFTGEGDKRSTPAGRLFVSMLQRFGVETDRFGGQWNAARLGAADMRKRATRRTGTTSQGQTSPTSRSKPETPHWPPASGGRRFAYALATLCFISILFQQKQLHAETGEQTATSAENGLAPHVQQYLKTHCHRCHGNQKQKADRRLDQFPRKAS